MMTLKQHAKIGNDKVLFILLAKADAQELAQEQIGRKLTHKEMDMVEDEVNESMPWYEVLSSAINIAVKEAKP